MGSWNQTQRQKKVYDKDMALLSILVATVLLILFLVFSGSSFSPFNKSAVKPKEVQSSATEAVEKTLENAKLEQSQVKNIDEMK